MERHLRLAEARGSLRAPNSRVQDQALEFLLVMRERDKVLGLIDQIKVQGLRAPGLAEGALSALFPEIFPPDPFQKAQQDDGTYDIDAIEDDKVEWSVPSDLDTDADISAWIESKETGTVTGADLEDWR